MKKFLTGAVCAAAIAAAAVVLLPVAAVRIAVRLSRPRDGDETGRTEAEPAPTGLLTGRDRGDEPLGSPVKSQVQSIGFRQDATWNRRLTRRP
ncbi:MAG: hypothetical protein A4E69_02008 [Syntrophus sp. PtaB.Bin138]|nr:MAG: hypothetical protein A4E69_02008 [Syntrophus sp. PtaB.Bin138]